MRDRTRWPGGWLPLYSVRMVRRWIRGAGRVAVALLRGRPIGWVLVLVLVWPLSAHAQLPPPEPPAPPPPPPGSASSWEAVPPTRSPYGPAGEPPAPPPPYSPEWGAPNAAAAPMGRPQVYVDLRADNPRVRIDRVVEGVSIPVCQAPCRRWLDAQSTYQITGDGVRSTTRFVLPDDRSSVSLDVRAGSTGRLAGGVILISAGLVTAYIGSLIWEAGVLVESSPSPSDGRGAIRVGLGMLAVGVPAALIGVYLAVTSHTTVISSTGSTFTLDTPPPPRRPRSRVALTARGLEF